MQALQLPARTHHILHGLRVHLCMECVLIGSNPLSAVLSLSKHLSSQHCGPSTPAARRMLHPSTGRQKGTCRQQKPKLHVTCSRQQHWPATTTITHCSSALLEPALRSMLCWGTRANTGLHGVGKKESQRKGCAGPGALVVQHDLHATTSAPGSRAVLPEEQDEQPWLPIWC